jgi:hypothetical protein
MQSLFSRLLDACQKVLVLSLPIGAFASSSAHTVGLRGLGGSKLMLEVSDLRLLVARVLLVLLGCLGCRQQVLVLLV